MAVELERPFLSWLEGELAGSPVKPRVSVMREAGGVDYRHAEAQTVAVQWECPTLEAGRRWRDGGFSELAAKAESVFPAQLMIFTSIFKVI